MAESRNLDERILDILRNADGPLRARDIATALNDNTTRSEVNQALHSRLRRFVEQDRSYRWRMRPSSADRPAAPRHRRQETAPRAAATARTAAEPLPERVSKLLQYYIECVREDEGQAIRTFLSDAGNKYLDWHEAAELGTLDRVDFAVYLDDSQGAFARQLRQRSATSMLWYGYPLYVDWIQRSRSGWTGGFAIPMFLLSAEYELVGSELRLHFTPDWPRVNRAFLEKLFTTHEERRQLLDDLGLLDAEGEPPDGGIGDIVQRMAELELLQNVKEDLDPEHLSTIPPMAKIAQGGIYNRAALFIGEQPRFTAGLQKELVTLMESDAPGWRASALGTLLGERQAARRDSGRTIEVASLNKEQRDAVDAAFEEALTVVTGPPGTGKSQIVVSLVANAYLRGQRVLFTSRNNKTVDVVEARVNALAASPLLIRTGRQAGDRNLRVEVAEHMQALLALTPTDDDRRAYRELRAEYGALDMQRRTLWEELERIRAARNLVNRLDEALQDSRAAQSPAAWEALWEAPGVPNKDALAVAQSLAGRYANPSANPLMRFIRWLRRGEARTRIQRTAAVAAAACPVLSPHPDGEVSFAAWRNWFTAALATADVLTSIATYRAALADLGRLRSTDEVARQLRSVEEETVDVGARLIAAHARLAPDRISGDARQTLGDFRATFERLASDQIGGRTYYRLVDQLRALFPQVSELLPAWCVTNLSARGSLPFEANLFDLAVIDEASQCDIASALPILYRAKRAVIIGDPQQLRHISSVEQHRDQSLQARFGLDSSEDQIFGFSQNSLFDLAVSRGTVGTAIALRDHYRSHADIVGFSNQEWYQDSLRVWTDYRQLSSPSPDRVGIRWTNVEGSATRPNTGGALIQAEAAAVVDELLDLLDRRQFAGTVGVVTPFRAQANRIRDLATQRLSRDRLGHAQLIVDTAHGFQGDERDVILFSPCVSTDLPRGARYFLASTGNLFNVAITRARSLLQVVGNQDACLSAGIPHIERFAGFCAELERAKTSPYQTTLASDGRVGPWEQPLYEALVAAGLHPVPQYAGEPVSTRPGDRD